MDKTQRLRNCAEGFMAGLVMAGFPGPWRWDSHQWEGSFYRVWRRWEPQQRSPKLFPTFEVGGVGRTSQAREILWQLKRTSPFFTYDSEPLVRLPHGLNPAEYVDVSVEGASANEWRELAAAFLAEMARWDDTRPGLTPASRT